MQPPLTLKQRALQLYIEKYMREHNGVAPSSVDIAREFGVSNNAAQALVSRLIAKGVARRTRAWRSLELISE